MTSDERSRIMRAVKSRDTAPELFVRRLVHKLGYRFRLHKKNLPGNPDLTFASRRKVIFVHGCFWHGHTCPRGARIPKTNRLYWLAKITRNKERDKQSILRLTKQGWDALIVWECQIKDQTILAKRLVRFLEKASFNGIKFRSTNSRRRS